MTAKHDFMKHRKVFFTISLVLVAFILGTALILGVPMDIQFKGGAMAVLGYQGELDLSGVKATVSDVLGSGLTFQQGSDIATGANSLTITMPGAQTVSAEQMEDTLDALQASFADNDFEMLKMNNVPPTIGREFFHKSWVAVGAACLLILAYIAVRFRKIGGLPAGVMAIIALLNDLLIVFGVFVVLRIPLNGNFIAAMLTILGYSINDTVVMYDRIRENESIYGRKLGFEALVNTSINQSLRRSVNTTVTTCMALATVCVIAVLFGLDSIFTFALPLMIGMISGLYTSLFITTSLWVTWENYKAKHHIGKKK